MLNLYIYRVLLRCRGERVVRELTRGVQLQRIRVTAKKERKRTNLVSAINHRSKVAPFVCIFALDCDSTAQEVASLIIFIVNFNFLVFHSPYPLVAESSLHGAVQGEVRSIVVNASALDTFDRQGVGHQQRPNKRTDEQCLVHVVSASTNGLLVSYFPVAQDYISSDNVVGSPRSHGVSFSIT